MIISQRVAYTCWARVKFEHWWSHSLNDSSQLRASIDPWSRSTTRRIFFQSSCIIHETTPVSLFLPFPPQTFFHQSCHRFSLWFPFLLHLFFLSLFFLIDLVLYPRSFFWAEYAPIPRQIYTKRRVITGVSISLFIPFHWERIEIKTHACAPPPLWCVVTSFKWLNCKRPKAWRIAVIFGD